MPKLSQVRSASLDVTVGRLTSMRFDEVAIVVARLAQTTGGQATLLALREALNDLDREESQ